MVAGRVEDSADRVRGSHAYVEHDRLRLPGHEVGAVSHANSQVLVGGQHRLGEVAELGLGEPCICLDDGGEVGASVHVHSLNAVRPEKRQVLLGGRFECRLVDTAHRATPRSSDVWHARPRY